MIHRSALALTVCLATLFVSVGAQAADDEVRRLESRGRQAYGEGRYAEAVTAFRAAYKLNPQAKYYYNIAKAQEKLARYLDAIESYQRYLLEAPDAPDRADVEVTVKLVRQKLATVKAELKVLTKPPGVDLVLRGESGERAGQTPYSTWLDFGEYTLVLSADGYQTETRKVRLEEGRPLHLEIALRDGDDPPPPPADLAPDPEAETSATTAPAPPGPPKARRSWFSMGRWIGIGAVGLGTIIALVGAADAGKNDPPVATSIDGSVKVCGTTGDRWTCDPGPGRLSMVMGLLVMGGGGVLIWLDPLSDTLAGPRIAPLSDGGVITMTGRF